MLIAEFSSLVQNSGFSFAWLKTMQKSDRSLFRDMSEHTEREREIERGGRMSQACYLSKIAA